MPGMLRVIVAGVTGWTGEPLARAVREADDLEIVAGVARSGGGTHTSVPDALSSVAADVFVDYTSAAAVRGNVDAAVAAGLNVVVGSSGLTEDDFSAIDADPLAAGDQAFMFADGIAFVAYQPGTVTTLRGSDGTITVQADTGAGVLSFRVQGATGLAADDFLL